jgi:hypothetical protein
MFILKWIEDHPQWVGIFLYSILEAWLGRTKKINASSVIEVIFNLIREAYRARKRSKHSVESLANSKE